jgi:hypothetical protein
VQQQVSEESLNLKELLSSFKEPLSHPQPKQKREREGRKRGRGVEVG